MKFIKNNLHVTCFIIFAIVFLSFISNVTALEPSFNLVVIPDKAEYDPEDNVTLYILIDGLGKIDGGSLYVYVPDYLSENNTLTFVYYSLKCSIYSEENKSNSSPNKCCEPHGSPIYIKTNMSSITAPLFSEYFGHDCEKNNLLTNKFDSKNSPPTPLMQIKFNINKESPSGDNFAYISFSYEYNNKAYLLDSTPKIKVTTYYDRNIFWMTLVGLFIGIITIMSPFINGVKKIICWVKRQFQYVKVMFS